MHLHASSSSSSEASPPSPSMTSHRAIALRKKALLARAAVERGVFSQACTQLSGSPYIKGILGVSMPNHLKSFAQGWKQPYQLAKIILPFIFSTPYIRTAILKFVGKQAWRYVKWGLIGFTAWKGGITVLKMLSLNPLNRSNKT